MRRTSAPSAVRTPDTMLTTEPAFPAPAAEASRRCQGTLQRVKVDMITQGGLDGRWDEQPVDASGVTLY